MVREMGLAATNATFMRTVRRSLHHFLTLALAVSTLSAISISVAPSATAAGAGLSLYVKNESASITTFERSEFTTGTCHTQATSTIDFQWGSGSPGGSCNSDKFTVYATGQILAPVTGTVRFCAIADDGFFLDINGYYVINDWVDQGADPNCNSIGTFEMTAGQVYPIKIWMYEYGGGAWMQLLWSYTGQDVFQIVPASNLGTFCSPSSTSSGGYTILTFTSTTACQWSVPAGVTTADVLVVGGGGGGGRGGPLGNEGGGGGGGGVIETTGISVSGSYLIAVGAGGAADQNGTGSSALGVSVSGGGKGGTANQPGGNGASGGGGTHNATNGGTGITGQGFAGGTPSSGSRGGGGGGAGEAGNTDGQGHGGDGKVSVITGSTYGGGGTGANNSGALGGTGGGGVTNASFDQPFSISSNGSANTGGGGAGGFTNSGNDNAGNGGSGVVVIRYINTPSITLSTSTITGAVNYAISSYSITNSGGTASSYSIPSADSTAIAAIGLSFSTSTGLISGTPSGALASRSITITATNSSGTSTSTFSLTVSLTLSCAAGGVCNVGDTGPGGGIVFYVAPTFFTQESATGSMCTTNCKYLEAAPSTWSGGSTDPSRHWATNINSNRTTAVTGARGTAIGTGYKNSLAIVAQTGNVAASSAAVAVREYSGGSKNDWFLPSKDELNQMCKWARGIAWTSDATVCDSSGAINSGSGASGFVANVYWSSSESFDHVAWGQFFNDGFQNSTGKEYPFYLRPVRAFGPAPTVISEAAIAGVTAPVTGATPVTTTTAGTGYTGTVTWSSSPSTFAPTTTYTATITLTAAPGFTLTGVTANFFTVTGATSVTHLADSGSITAGFPATGAVAPALTPTFGSTTATADGFTVQISNYNASYTWGGSATASGSVAISGLGLVTVTGVAPGTSSTATITTTRTGYTGGSATVSATSTTGAALTPTFGSTTATADGFTVQISNYDASYTWAEVQLPVALLQLAA